MYNEEMPSFSDDELDMDAVNAMPKFDAAEYLDNDEAIGVFLNEYLKEADAGMIAHGLGIVARARGMTQIAKDAGMTREGLYKALRHDSAPRLDTVMRVVNALGYYLKVEKVPSAEKMTKAVARAMAKHSESMRQYVEVQYHSVRAAGHHSYHVLRNESIAAASTAAAASSEIVDNAHPYLKLFYGNFFGAAMPQVVVIGVAAKAADTLPEVHRAPADIMSTVRGKEDSKPTPIIKHSHH